MGGSKSLLECLVVLLLFVLYTSSAELLQHESVDSSGIDAALLNSSGKLNSIERGHIESAYANASVDDATNISALNNTISMAEKDGRTGEGEPGNEGEGTSSGTDQAAEAAANEAEAGGDAAVGAAEGDDSRNEMETISESIFAESLPSMFVSDECADKCTKHTCSGHGKCEGPECECTCRSGFSGSRCEERIATILHFRLRQPPKPCPDGCSNNGKCLHNGKCQCSRGWAGYNCSLQCAGGFQNPCSGHGTCNMEDGKCLCDEGYAGKNCTRRTVPQDVNEYRKNILGEEQQKQNEQGAETGSITPNQTVPVVNQQVVVENVTGVNKTNTSKVEVPAVKDALAIVYEKGRVVDNAQVTAHGVNRAAFDLGSKALASNKEANGASALLKNDKDKYWISPCKLEKGVKWVVIELGEIIYVHTIVLGSFEYYSSTIDAFQVLGQVVYPTDQWNVLGHFQASPTRRFQEFKLKTPAMVKYLKFRWLSHHGSEFYCTLSSIKVYGRTQWEEMGRMLDANEEVVEKAKRRLGGAPEKEEEATGQQSDSPPASDSNTTIGSEGGDVQRYEEEGAKPVDSGAAKVASDVAANLPPAPASKNESVASPAAAQSGSLNVSVDSSQDVVEKEAPAGNSSAAILLPNSSGTKPADNPSDAGASQGSVQTSSSNTDTTKAAVKTHESSVLLSPDSVVNATNASQNSTKISDPAIQSASKPSDFRASSSGVEVHTEAEVQPAVDDSSGGQSSAATAKDSSDGDQVPPASVSAVTNAGKEGANGADLAPEEAQQSSTKNCDDCGGQTEVSKQVNVEGVVGGDSADVRVSSESAKNLSQQIVSETEESVPKEHEAACTDGTFQATAEAGQLVPTNSEGSGDAGDYGHAAVDGKAEEASGEGVKECTEHVDVVVMGEEVRKKQEELKEIEEEARRKEEETRKREEEEQVRRMKDEEEARKKKEEEEEAKKKREDDLKKAMGIITPPKGEMSFFQKVPSKIKDLEINQSLLESYIQDLKKQYDETFQDLQNEIKSLQDGMQQVKTDMSSAMASLEERVKGLYESTKEMHKLHLEHRELIQNNRKEVDNMLNSGQGSTRWWLYFETYAVLIALSLLVRHCMPNISVGLRYIDSLLISVAKHLSRSSRRYPHHSLVSRLLFKLSVLVAPPGHTANLLKRASSLPTNPNPPIRRNSASELVDKQHQQSKMTMLSEHAWHTEANLFRATSQPVKAQSVKKMQRKKGPSASPSPLLKQPPQSASPLPNRPGYSPEQQKPFSILVSKFPEHPLQPKSQCPEPSRPRSMSTRTLEVPLSELSYNSSSATLSSFTTSNTNDTSPQILDWSVQLTARGIEPYFADNDGGDSAAESLTGWSGSAAGSKLNGTGISVFKRCGSESSMISKGSLTRSPGSRGNSGKDMHSSLVAKQRRKSQTIESIDLALPPENAGRSVSEEIEAVADFRTAKKSWERRTQSLQNLQDIKQYSRWKSAVLPNMYDMLPSQTESDHNDDQ